MTAHAGDETARGAELEVRNPATGERIGVVPALGQGDVAALVARARAAQRDWAGLPVAQRADVLDRCRRALVRRRAEVVATLRAETGKTFEDAMLWELLGAVEAMHFWSRQAGRYLRDERVPGRSLTLVGRRTFVHRFPLGVVGVIAPWNYPLLLGLDDAVPALLAGNVVVLKPSERTPLATRQAAEIFHTAGLPEDVLIVATGAAPTGEALVDAADMVMFTGSTSSGRRVATRAGERLIPASLELGGKDPMIVCADADIERAAELAATYGLSNAGQSCQSIERVYVEQPVYDSFVEQLLERVARVRPRPGGGAGEGDYGPTAAAEQLETIQRHVDDAVAKGARVLTGGAPVDGGRVYPPTVIVDVDHSMQCMHEETFGPTLPVMRVADLDTAVRLANDSRYGLSSSVCTRDLAKGRRIAAQLAAGSTCVNDAAATFQARRAPFGGWRESGLGVRHGAEGIRKYTRPHTVTVARPRPRRELHFFPNRRLASRALERVLVLLHGR